MPGLRSALEERLIRIDDLGDRRLEDYRDIRERQLQTRQTFIAESEIVLRVLVARGRHPIKSVLVAETRLEKIREALIALPAEVPIYLAPQALLDATAGFHMHRGILAACERLPLPTVEALIASLGAAPRRVVVLESLTNHDNVGGVFRNAAAFGADAVLFDRATCDPLYRKAIRVSVGATLFVPYARSADTAESLAVLRRHGFSIVALTPTGNDELSRFAPPERLALLFGTEGAGLAPETLADVNATARITMAEAFDSLNVATTSGIALHAFRR